MAKRGRPPGSRSKVRMTDEHREKIQNSGILNALVDFSLGLREMSPAQASTGIALLRKVMPDLSQVESNSTVEHRYVARVPDKFATVEQWQQQHEQPTQH